MNGFMTLVLVFLVGAPRTHAGALNVLTPATDNRGQPRITMMYAYDTIHRWTLKLTPDLPEAELERLTRGPAHWRLIDRQSRVVYQDWTALKRGEGEDRAALVFRIADVTAVRALLQRLPGATLEVDGPAPASLPIARVCTEFAGTVLDMTNPFGPACVVKPEVLSQVDRACLAELARAALEVRRGLVTCNHANDKMFRLGCSYLTCPP